MRHTHNTLSEEIRSQVIEILNHHLAAAIDLQAQVKQAHWNVRGPGFIAVHELFDKVAAAVGDYGDMIAERVGALGGKAEGTLPVALANSFLLPYEVGIADVKQHVFAVASALAAFGQSAREAIDTVDDAGDKVTADLFTEVVRGLDEQIWFVESHILTD
ncbi:MAG: DNA starvation/stationary phase protection protein Dps [Gemmatimonadaceae bacterium]|nr:DNA starvation/stationary phase protection protein Dps [Gemmatimonadaceae bacterium]